MRSAPPIFFQTSAPPPSRRPHSGGLFSFLITIATTGDITMQTASNLIEIPFNKLILWDGNVRKTGIESGLDELAASIEAHGLINPLLVRKEPKGRYAVIAG